MNIKDIDEKIKFLKSALYGGHIVLNKKNINISDEDRNKYTEQNTQIESEIEGLKRRKENIIRKQKIKKITDGC